MLFIKIFKHPIFTNSLWAVFGSFVSKGFNFASIAWIAKILGPESYGEYNVIQTTIGMFGTVSGLGMGLAATKLIAEFRGRDNAKVSKIISTLYVLSFIISLCVAIVFFATSDVVASSLLNNKKLTILLQITAILFFMGYFSSSVVQVQDNIIISNLNKCVELFVPY